MQMQIGSSNRLHRSNSDFATSLSRCNSMEGRMIQNNNSSSKKKCFRDSKIGKRRKISDKKIDDEAEAVSPCFFITDDLIEHILTRVHTKTLLRCMCVCKRWRSLISDPTFFNNFVKISTPLIFGVFYGQTKPDDSYVGEADFYDFAREKIDLNDTPLDMSLTFLQRDIMVVASHNGFLLCAEKPNGKICFPYRVHYILCNPLTKQWVDLPRCRCNHYIKHTVLFCYEKEGYNGQQLEFKVVSFMRWQDLGSSVHTYSSETGKWKVSRIYHDASFLTYCDMYILFNESVYFGGYRNPNLLVYDLKEGSLSSLELPPPRNPGRFSRELLGVSAGSLYYAESSVTCLTVWILVDGVEWSLKHNIDYISLRDAFPQIFKSWGGVYPIAFHPLNHEYVLVNLWKPERYIDNPSKEVFLYHTGTRKIQLTNNFNLGFDSPVIPYSVPAWLLCLKNTLKQSELPMQKRQKGNRLKNECHKLHSY